MTRESPYRQYCTGSRRLTRARTAYRTGHFGHTSSRTGGNVTEFELLVIPLSVLLGVGAARMLESLVHAVRYQDKAPLHWLPIAWGAFIFMYIITFFSVLWAVDSQNPSGWTWPLFGMQLVHAVLLFLSAGLILASDARALDLGMLGNFERHGRLALVPLGLLFVVAIPFNKWSRGPDWISAPNLLNVILLALIVWVFRTERVTARAVGTISFGAVSAIGWFIVFARPGAM